LSTFLLSLLAVIFVTSCQNSSQKTGNIQVKVDFENGSNQTVYLQLLKSNDAITLDTIVLDENGKGKINFEGDQISFYSLIFEGKEGEARFIADKDDKISLTGDIDKLFLTLRTEGNQSSESLNEFHVILLDYNTFLDSLKNEYNILKEKNMHFAKEEEFNSLYIQKSIGLENSVKSFIDKHEGQFINILAIRSLNPKNNIEYYKKVNNTLKDKYSESHYVQFF